MAPARREEGIGPLGDPGQEDLLRESPGLSLETQLLQDMFGSELGEGLP